MNITKSIQRIKWRFSQGKSFIPNQNDIESYNDIAEYANQNQKQQIVDNVLFTKLYIHVLGELHRHYEVPITNNTPQKELHKILNKTMNLTIDEFREKINHQELNSIKDIDSFQNFKEISFDECVDNLKIMSTEAINHFSPKHLNRVG